MCSTTAWSRLATSRPIGNHTTLNTHRNIATFQCGCQPALPTVAQRRRHRVDRQVDAFLHARVGFAGAVAARDGKLPPPSSESGFVGDPQTASHRPGAASPSLACSCRLCRWRSIWMRATRSLTWLSSTKPRKSRCGTQSVPSPAASSSSWWVIQSSFHRRTFSTSQPTQTRTARHWSTSTPRSDLAKAVCRVVGMARTPADAEARVIAVIERMITAGTLMEAGGYLRPT